MIGAVIGDIVGSRFEHSEDEREYDFDLFIDDSEALTFMDKNKFTDDTVHTFAVFDWITSDISISEALRSYTNKYPKRGYGMRFKMWADNPHVGPYGSYGNGSAMRISSIPHLFHDNREKMLDIVEIACSPTHNHPEGIKGAKATADCIWYSLNGKDKDFIENHIETKYEYDLSPDKVKELAKVRSYTCQNTVPVAIRMFLDSTDFEDAIRLSVVNGKDSDTIACIAGSISAAFYPKIPGDMVNESIKRLSDEFIKMYVKFLQL